MASGSNALDMALDDVITQTRSSRHRTNTRGRGGSSNGGISKPARTGFRSGNNNYSRSPLGSRPERNGPQRTSRTNLVVANLHYKVTESDLYELFGQMGPVKRAFLHLGPDGNSAGVADVVFAYPPDAERALASYNNVELDGRPMRISFAVPVTGVLAPTGGPVRRPVRGNANNRNQSQSRGRGRGGRRQDSRPKPSEADLDADMDSYMATP